MREETGCAISMTHLLCLYDKGLSYKKRTSFFLFCANDQIQDLEMLVSTIAILLLIYTPNFVKITKQKSGKIYTIQFLTLKIIHYLLLILCACDYLSYVYHFCAGALRSQTRAHTHPWGNL